MANDRRAASDPGLRDLHDEPPADRAEELTEAQLKELEERFDPEMRFRPLSPALGWFAAAALFVLACYHYYTAGFGIPQATLHRGAHLAFTLGLVFLSFATFGRGTVGRGPLFPLGLPLWDWALAVAGVVSALYVPWIFDDLAFRVGDTAADRRDHGHGPHRRAAGGDAARDGLAAADHRAPLHRLRLFRAARCRACSPIPAPRGRASSTTST